MKYLLEVKEVNKNFGGVVAAENVSLTVSEGMIRGLIGPNGAGKTTLLNLISGIYNVDSGNIYLMDQIVTNTPPYNRARMGLGRTFQSPRFLHRSSIRDNMLMGTDLYEQTGYAKSFFKFFGGSSFQVELDELMVIAGIKVDWEASILSLPYGQQKLLEIVRTLLSHPKVMLVDEPAAGLNGAEIDKAIALLKYGAEKGIGVVLIEHSMDMVMNICDYVTVLNFGRVICDDTPSVVTRNEQVIEAYLGRKR